MTSKNRSIHVLHDILTTYVFDLIRTENISAKEITEVVIALRERETINSNETGKFNAKRLSRKELEDSVNYQIYNYSHSELKRRPLDNSNLVMKYKEEAIILAQKLLNPTGIISEDTMLQCISLFGKTLVEQYEQHFPNTKSNITPRGVAMIEDICVLDDKELIDSDCTLVKTF